MDDKNWPAWFYGPDGASKVCETEADVPEGWASHPSLVGKPAGTPLVQVEDDTADAIEPLAKVVDASGVAWDEAINTSNRAQTASGLWQLLPGKSRPDPVVHDL